MNSDTRGVQGVLNPEGYDIYSVKPGDTLFNISKHFGTSLEAVFTANPGINPIDLKDGQKLVIPYGTDVVRTSEGYDAKKLERDINGLKKRYPFLETGTAGKSILNRSIHYIRLGSGSREIFINAAHHANEWVTSLILMKFIEDFSRAYANGGSLGNCRVAGVWERNSVYLIPMVNPDGVDLVVNGIKPDNPYFNKILSWNMGSRDVSSWSANIRGVDLNHNYSAGWQLSKQRESMYGVFGPGPFRYSGPQPESEPEARAMVAFTRSHSFQRALSYHAGRGLIFWTYNDFQPSQARELAHMFSRVSGYSLLESENLISPSGFKEWFIKEYSRPAYTVETNSLLVSNFDRMYRENRDLLLLALMI